jgi:CHAD domain-containing protein
MEMATERPGPGTGLSWYAVQKLPPLLDAFTKEIEGVRESEDIEYIHRMRVASRRLRAALPLFRPCFTDKQYAKWMLEITRITRALGEARDADVQMAHLRKFLKKQEKEINRKKESSSREASPVPAARYLLDGLGKRRAHLQQPVIAALSALEKSRVIPDMRTAFMNREQEVRSVRKRLPLHAIPMEAAWRIETRLLAMLSFEPWISHPEAVAEHHATRIAAKKLRYTLEIYGTAYRNGLNKHLVRVKRIQEILGDLHDCDVWIDEITTLLLKERTLLRTYKGEKRPDPATLASMKVFLAEKEKERRALYRQFTHYWAMLGRTGIWQDLRESLTQKRKARYLPPSPPDEKSIRAAVERLTQTFPEVAGHSRTVTGLALMLFDSLEPLHKLGSRERFLLECAGLLHDIGWKYGQKGHNRRGARMVLMDEGLPFDLAERSIISLMVATHRGGTMLEDDPLYNLLSSDNRKKTLVLASLLRIADGLDFMHTGTVQEIHCIISDSMIGCDLTSVADCTAEKQRAQAKADLFPGAFGRSVVIR